MSYVPDCESLFDTAKSGYNALEELSLEFSSGNFYLIGGRPGMGKTALMLDIALHAAENDSTPVFIFSLDKTAEQLTMRLISKYSNIPLDQCLCGDRDCIPTLELVRDKIAKLPIFICDEVVTVNEITEIIHSEKMRGLVFIDFLQLIDVGVEQYGNSNNAICSQPVFERQFEISNCLKSIAQDENTAIIALAQLARRLEERADKRPILGDIRYNRFIEQVADSIVYIYRYSYYYWGEDETEQSDSAELIVAKNRFGKTGNAIVKYDRDTTSFVE